MRMPAAGFGLFEALLSLALVTVLSTAVYALVVPATTASAVSGENARLDALVQGIDATYTSGVDYAGLALAPYPVAGHQPATSAWGQPFSVLPLQIVQPADAWVATYQGVPSDVCAQMGGAQWVSHRWFEIAVDGQTVASAGALRAACTPTKDFAPHELQLVRYNGRRPYATSGLPPVCWDKTREQVAAGDWETGCSHDPALYRAATRPVP